MITDPMKSTYGVTKYSRVVNTLIFADRPTVADLTFPQCDCIWDKSCAVTVSLQYLTTGILTNGFMTEFFQPCLFYGKTFTSYKLEQKEYVINLEHGESFEFM